MSATLLALTIDLNQRAEIVRLAAQDSADTETNALATAAWAICIELERAAETLTKTTAPPSRPGIDPVGSWYPQ